MKLSFDVDGRSSISRPILVEGRGMGFEGMTPLKHEKSQLAGTNWDHNYASCFILPSAKRSFRRRCVGISSQFRE